MEKISLKNLKNGHDYSGYEGYDERLSPILIAIPPQNQYFSKDFTNLGFSQDILIDRKVSIDEVRKQKLELHHPAALHSSEPSI